jgi:adenylate cyclase class 2
MRIEFEAKFFDIDIHRLYQALSNHGAVLLHEKKLLRRRTFDFPHKTIDKQWVRVRDEGGSVTVTFKKVASPVTIDGTHELEFGVDSFEKACDFLMICGMIPRAYQVNYRESWTYQNGIVTIDTWPGLAPYVEIEADNEEQVRCLSTLLGFDFNKAYFGTVDKIYEQFLGIPADKFNQINELTFENIDEIVELFTLERDAK